LRAKRSEDPQSPENQWSVFHEMAGQALHDRLLRQLHEKINKYLFLNPSNYYFLVSINIATFVEKISK